MKFKFLIHSTYDAFLSDREQTTFTANVKGAKTFKSYYEAEHYAFKLEAVNKLTHKSWHILGLPQL